MSLNNGLEYLLSVRRILIPISLVGYVNMNKLTAHNFKPFVFIRSSASFLTKDYAGYKAAKNASETLKPATRIFQIYPPSSSDDWIYNKN